MDALHLCVCDHPAATEKPADRIAKFISTYEAALSLPSSGGYLAGAPMTYVDLASYQIVRVALTNYGLKPGPKLAAWLDVMAATKAAKAIAAKGIVVVP